MDKNIGLIKMLLSCNNTITCLSDNNYYDETQCIIINKIPNMVEHYVNLKILDIAGLGILELPYNHNMNPIERFFNQLKHYIRKDEPMSYEDVKKSIRRAIKHIDKNNMSNYFKSSLQISKEEIEKIKSKYHKKPRKYKD